MSNGELTADQWRFIAARLLANTDKQAAEQVGLNPTTIANWKYEYPAFLAQYEASFKDGVDVAKTYTRKMLGKAAQRLNEALDAAATDGAIDYKSRLKAVELSFKAHGLLTDRVQWTPDLSGMSAEELQTLERVLGRIPDPTG